ncbi:MAG: GntR family transcriptional regulator [Actinobacteria bacterium]|nr:GntR family transcriptional regulator [Actinomycetota bacterium]
MELKIIQNNLSGEAYKKIKLMILEGVLKPGEKIIQEKMAQSLGISKIPLIQALSVLQKERLLSYNHRKGFTVRKISTHEFHDLLDLRGVLEGLAAKRMAYNLNDDMKKHLLGFMNDFIKYRANNNYKKYSELDKKFHFYILENSGNSYLPHINNSFNLLILIYSKGFKSELDASLDYHKMIITAIMEGRGKEAAMLMEEHFEKAKVYF